MEADKRQSLLRTLHVLLVISFVNTGIYLFSELVSGLTLPLMAQYYEAHPDLFPDQWNIMLERVLRIPQWYYLLSALLDVASVVGLVLMWRLRKNGFHCYTLSKLLLMLMPMLFLDRSYVGLGNMMLAVLFIAYYFFLLRSLDAFKQGGTPPLSPASQNN